MTILTGLRQKNDIAGKGESVRICWETSEKIIEIMNEGEPERVKAGVEERLMFGATFPTSIDCNALTILTGALTKLIDCSDPNSKPTMLIAAVKMLVAQVIGNEELAAIFMLTLALQMNEDVASGKGAMGLPTVDKLSIN